MAFDYSNVQNEYEALQAEVHKMMNRRINVVDGQICDYLTSVVVKDRLLKRGTNLSFVLGAIIALVGVVGLLAQWAYTWPVIGVLVAALICLAVYNFRTFKAIGTMVGSEDGGEGFDVTPWNEQAPECYIAQADKAATLLRDGMIVGVDHFVTTTKAFRRVIEAFPKAGENIVVSRPIGDVAYVLALGKVWAVEGENVGVEFTVSQDNEFHWADKDNALSVVAVPKPYWINCLLDGNPNNVAEAYLPEGCDEST